MELDFTRRQFLGATGAALAAGAFPGLGADVPVRTGQLVRDRRKIQARAAVK